MKCIYLISILYFYVSLSLPSGYHEGVLTSTDAATVTSNWIYSEPGTEEYISFIIDNLSTICIRDDNNELVGWLLQPTLGAFGMLHVIDGHRRHGLGKYMVQKLSQQLLQNDKRPFVLIQMSNKQSVELHEKCGYENTNDACAWIQTFTKDGKK